MGLTIHYRLKHSTRTPAVARQLVERLRQRALDLPFQQVGPLVELTGDACVPAWAAGRGGPSARLSTPATPPVAASPTSCVVTCWWCE